MGGSKSGGEEEDEENQKLAVLTITAPEGLELIAKRTHDYMTMKSIVLFLVVYSWPSYFHASGGGMTSGIIYGQIIGSFMMLVGEWRKNVNILGGKKCGNPPLYFFHGTLSLSLSLSLCSRCCHLVVRFDVLAFCDHSWYIVS